MTGKEVSLMEMLESRENRMIKQDTLLKKYPETLICFTMNIAGPIKNNALIRRAFEYGCKVLKMQLSMAGINCLYQERLHYNTGNEAYFCVDGDNLIIKRITTEIEQNLPIGRLFDMDVLDQNGRHIERGETGFSKRKCLICEKEAKECARNRTHTVEQLQKKTEIMLKKEFEKLDCQNIAQLACKSLLYEVNTTPKPGLVDRYNSGSHKDMDCFTFISSASALWPYFEKCVKIGMDTADQKPEETLARLRWEGKMAEIVMNMATEGVNTHKGAIFSMGVLCGAVGRLPRETWKDTERILKECGAMTRGISKHDFANTTKENARTAGEKLFVQYGITGIRGQAENSFPAVYHTGLPVLEEGLKQGLSLNEAGCGALLAILSSSDDTNMIARSNRDTQLKIKKEIASLIEEQPFPNEQTLLELDTSFIDQNLSPGGSADLLALTYFLYFLKEQDCHGIYNFTDKP